MKIKTLLNIFLAAFLTFATIPTLRVASSAAQPALPGSARGSAALGNSPVMFIENVGQFADEIRFQARGSQGVLDLADNALTITVFGPQASNQALTLPGARPSQLEMPSSQNRQAIRLKLSFTGANTSPLIEPFDRLDTHVSYYLGNDPAKWHVDVPVWGGVRYKDLYPGIDLELISEAGQWQPRLVMHPGANLNAVNLRVEGADSLRLDGQSLLMETAFGETRLPLLQVENAVGDNLPAPILTGSQVKTPFAALSILSSVSSVKGAGQVEASDSSDLLYGTYLGGSSDNDYAMGIAVGPDGAAYITGWTTCPDFASPSGMTCPTGDTLFAAKLNPAGSALDYIAYFGELYMDAGWGIAVDTSGAAYITGSGWGCDMPTTAGAYQTGCITDPNDPTNHYSDGYLLKLSPTGSLVYGTYLGVAGVVEDCSGQKCPTGGAEGWGIAIDSSGAAYVTGDFFSTVTGSDVFVLKLNPAGSGRDYFRVLKGSSSETEGGIAVDANGAAYVTGITLSPDFPVTSGAFQTIMDKGASTCTGTCADAFVVKVNTSGSVAYSTFLGGSGYEAYPRISVDTSGSAYVLGRTESNNFPTTSGAFDTNFNGTFTDAFVAKLSPQGSGLEYGTYLGGGGEDSSAGIVVDPSGAAYVTGYTTSGYTFPTTPGSLNPGNPPTGATVYVAKLNSSGSVLIYSTLLGGSISASGNGVPVTPTGIAIDSSGAAYVTGYTTQADFPTTPGAYDPSLNGYGGDAIVAKLAMKGNSHVNLQASTNPSVSGQALTYTAQVLADTPDSGSPSGSVQFGLNGTDIGVAVPLAGDSAQSAPVIIPATGNYTITARYSGDGSFKPSSNTLTQTVTPADTTLTISAHTPQPSLVGQAVRVDFAATVNAPGSGTPTGDVTVTSGLQSCSASLAVGNCSITFDTTGEKTISAAYAGDGNFNGSVSASEPHNVNNPFPGLSSLSPASAGTGGLTFTLTVSGTNFVDGAVARWNGADLATNFVDATQLTASVPAADLAASGVAYINVVNPGPGGGGSDPQAFYITQTGAGITAASTASGTDPSATTGSTGISASASGNGTLSVAEFDSNPGGLASFNSMGAFVDLHLGAGNTFTALTVEDCDLNGGNRLYWWNGSLWALASDQVYHPATLCVTITVNSSTSPSLADLTGTPFGAAKNYSLYLPLIRR